jgi:hypothetical protein
MASNAKKVPNPAVAATALGMQMINRIAAILLCGALMAWTGCESMMPALPGLHFRSDSVAVSMPEAQQAGRSLAAEIALKTGLVAAPLYVVDNQRTSAIYVNMQDDRGFVISCDIYPRNHSVLLAVADTRPRWGTDSTSQARVKQLAETARQIVEAHFPGHALTPWTPKQGIFAP